MSEAISNVSELEILPGLKKASVLMIALGAEMSTDIMQHLSPDDIERITSEIVALKKVDPKLREAVLVETKKKLREKQSAGGTEYAFKILEQVFGETKAKEMMGKLNSNSPSALFRAVKGVAPRILAQVLANEKPQVIALVIGYLEANQAAQVLGLLPEDKRGEAALKLTIMQSTTPDVVKNILDNILHRITIAGNAAFSDVGGIKSIVDILNNSDRATERKILDYLKEVDEDIANKIQESMFVFDDIASLEDRAIQTILRDIPQEELRMALKAVGNETKEVFFRNMSQRAAETLKDDLESTGPIKLKDVEAAQSRIAGVARLLDSQGEISIRSGGDDTLV